MLRCSQPVWIIILKISSLTLIARNRLNKPPLKQNSSEISHEDDYYLLFIVSASLHSLFRHALGLLTCSDVAKRLELSCWKSQISLWLQEIASMNRHSCRSLQRFRMSMIIIYCCSVWQVKLALQTCFRSPHMLRCSQTDGTIMLKTSKFTLIKRNRLNKPPFKQNSSEISHEDDHHLLL